MADARGSQGAPEEENTDAVDAEDFPDDGRSSAGRLRKGDNRGVRNGRGAWGYTRWNQGWLAASSNGGRRTI